MNHYKLSFLLIFISIVSFAQSKEHHHKDERAISFPDIPNFKTLVTDLHLHSVFSDGKVWPNIRVLEALKDDLDAIAITEHLEYQPHSKDIPHSDRNRAYEIAKEEAKDHDLLVINGGEITRDLPPGHANAIFISDVNVLKTEKAIDAFKEAKKQGAFIFWNHPNLIYQKKDGIAELTTMHKQLIKDKLLHGIEIVNEHTYSEEAFQIALENDLTLMGTSDIHGLIDWDYDVHDGGHRPVTLVFAKDKTKASLKEALFDKRTVVWFNNTLMGRLEFLDPLLKASIVVTNTETIKSYDGTETLVQEVTLQNNSDSDFILENSSLYALHNQNDVFTLKANSDQKIQVKTIEKSTSFELKFEVLNALVAPKKHTTLTLSCTNN